MLFKKNYQRSLFTIKSKLITIVVPDYDEESNIEYFYNSLKKVISNKENYEILFINDGSSDNTLNEIKKIGKKDKRVKFINFSRNFGKESALTAGIEFANGDCLIPIDADLQDPPHLINKLVENWKKGYDVVLAKRINRASDSSLKRVTAYIFYKFFNMLSETQIPENVGDFRLIDRKVIDALKKLPETNRFMKGLFAWIGFKTTVIEYERPARKKGLTKFTAFSLVKLALAGLISFSSAPLRIWTYLGIFFSASSFLYAFYVLFKTIIYGIDTPGYASIIIGILFMGGLQLLGIGIIGEYIGKTYSESKRRPPFIVSSKSENL